MREQHLFAARTRWDASPNPIASALTRLRAEGTAILDLTETNPTSCGFTAAAGLPLQALADPQGRRYQPDPRGLAATRASLAALYTAQGSPLSPERLILTAGTSEGYSHLFRLLCNPGDAVLVPSPSYPLLDFIATLADVTLHPYPLHYLNDRWCLDLEGLRAAIRPNTRALVVIHPNNPTGSFLKPAEVAALTALAAEHGLAVIADEVFADFALDAQHPEPFWSLAGRGTPALLFALGGLSKMLALPQMKLAWIAVDGPPAAAAAACERLEVMADTFLSVGTPVQLALPTWLPHRQTLQDEIRARLRTNLATLHRLAPGLALTVEGGWSAVLRLPRCMDDHQRVLSLLEHQRVLIDPGSFYGFAGDGHFVISLLPPLTTFEQGITRLRTALESPPADQAPPQVS